MFMELMKSLLERTDEFIIFDPAAYLTFSDLEMSTPSVRYRRDFHNSIFAEDLIVVDYVIVLFYKLVQTCNSVVTMDEVQLQSVWDCVVVREQLVKWCGK